MSGPLAAILIGSAAASAIGSIQQGNAAKASADFNAQVAERNATLATQQGTENAARIRRSNLQSQGAQRAAFGASGLRLSGSALNVLSDSAIQGELQALDAKTNAINESRGFKSKASLSRAQGRNARRAGFIGAGSTLLQGGAKAALALK